MRWVYSVGTEKPQPVIPEQLAHRKSGFFASLFSSFNAPPRAPSPLPTPRMDDSDLLSIKESEVVLSIFTAEVDVHLTKKVVSELLRSTKKNPPNKLKYELIYVIPVFYPSYRDGLTMNRLGKTNTMLARKVTKINLKLRGAYFKG
jgi:Protein of unknown function (DUF3684)